jgi:hypothetical protein
MSRDDIDRLWQKALHQSVADGEQFTRYHFAALVAAAEREECAQMAEHVMYGRDGCDRTAAAIRARGDK